MFKRLPFSSYLFHGRHGDDEAEAEHAGVGRDGRIRGELHDGDEEEKDVGDAPKLFEQILGHETPPLVLGGFDDVALVFGLDGRRLLHHLVAVVESRADEDCPIVLDAATARRTPFPLHNGRL